MEFTGADPTNATSRSRNIIKANSLSCFDLLQVVLVGEDGSKKSVKSGRVPYYELSELGELAKKLVELGIPGVKLFAREDTKSKSGADAFAEANIMARAIQEIKKAEASIYVATETCLCSYTNSGACAVHDDSGILNFDQTLDYFRKTALLHAKCGADAVGPAGMLLETISACRSALDANNYRHVAVMPHLIMKGPFYSLYREIMNTGSGEQRTAFHVEANRKGELLRVLRKMLDQRPDSILLEPALFVLDIIRETCASTNIPVGCFSVSGEYEILKHGSRTEDQYVLAATEMCRAAKRAGADFIATYAALDVARGLEEKK